MRRPLRAFLVTAPLLSLAVSACSAADSSTVSSTQSPTATVVSTTVAEELPADEGEPPMTSTSSTVLVAPSAATRTLTAFVQAHADSVNAGRPTTELVRTTSAAELDRQQVVVDFAVERGYAVPPRPVVAVVSTSASDAASDAVSVELGVCVWLPSTEYIDAETGQPPSGPVPSEWAPAVARLTRTNVTWVVDTLASPAGTSVDCREAS